VKTVTIKERRKIQDTERPEWVDHLDEEMKRRLELKDKRRKHGHK